MEISIISLTPPKVWNKNKKTNRPPKVEKKWIKKA